ncbi:MAG: PEP-CTERM sorting domain-containing protein [Opitutales bacterium]|nr:PEP-CTERM sorting domain-containing protein [Opitutales bacterium]
MNHKLPPLALSLLVCGAAAMQGQVLLTQASDDLFVINDGSFTQASGMFARSGDDARQGIVGSFSGWTLDNVGKKLEVTFQWQGGGTNNAGQQLLFGLFDGDAVTDNGQTAITDDWVGYFHAIGTRPDAGVNQTVAVYRQGEGDQPLMDRVSWTGGNTTADVDGQGNHAGSGGGANPRITINQNVTTNVQMTLERISATEITLTTVFDTDPDASGSNSATLGGIPTQWSASEGVGTIISTFTVGDGPTTLSGIALAGRTNFTLTDLTVIPEPRVYAALFGLAALGLVLLRRRRS